MIQKDNTHFDRSLKLLDNCTRMYCLYSRSIQTRYL